MVSISISRVPGVMLRRRMSSVNEVSPICWAIFGSETNEPLPRRRTMRPSRASSSSAARSVRRDTPRSPASRRSGGIGSPTASCSMSSSTRWRVTSCLVMSRWNHVSPDWSRTLGRPVDWNARRNQPQRRGGSRMSGTIMRDEIGQQPEAVERTLEALREPARELAGAIERRGVSSVVLVARGTSDHAALYARYLLEARCGLLSALAAPSLYTAYRAPVDLSKALVVGVSQSGQVPEIVDSLEYARARGALTAALTNDASSPMAEAADHVLATSAGPELAVVATKTFTTQLAAIALLAAELGADGVGESLPRVPEAMAGTIEQSS